MCPLYPFHVILLYLCLLLPLLFAVVEGSEELLANWRISFLPRKAGHLVEGNTTNANLLCEGCPDPASLAADYPGLKLVLMTDDPSVAGLEHQLKPGGGNEDDEEESGQLVLDVDDLGQQEDGMWSIPFRIRGRFLGFANVVAQIRDCGPSHITREAICRPVAVSGKPLSVAVERKKTIQSKIFAYSVALLVSLSYINMGCAMDLQVVRETLRRPIGPAIGFVCQFLVMPVLAYALGFVFDSPALRLGLFVTGASPGGGASNIWTVLFGGNLDLSVTMTAVSTFASFAMMPIWIFTLGSLIFADADFVIPYYKICTYAICLVVPLSIGLLLARCAPRVAKFLVRVLKPAALFIIVFILTFGVWANLYMFKLMSWRVIIAGMALPWLGFGFGCTAARVFGRNVADVTAIAIETGVQNTGISIFILWFTLKHPLGDMAGMCI